MIERTLEPEVMDEADEARQYDTMDHHEANQAFVDDLLQVCSNPRDVLDIGTGTARIPIELCRHVDPCRVMAADLSTEMLDLARYHIEIHAMIECIQLDRCDASQMPYQDGMFDLVMSNGFLHHIANPAKVLAEAIRVAAPHGFIFFRDLLRPADLETVDSLVTTYAGAANDRQRALFRQSLRAAFSLEEMRTFVAQLGLDPTSVQVTSDRHWTWVAVHDTTQ